MWNNPQRACAETQRRDDIAERWLDAVEGMRGVLPALRGDAAANNVATAAVACHHER
jgi:hypothetical protein